jgi:broad specificity phosphatase PhoE
MKVVCLRHFESKFNENPLCTEKNVGLSSYDEKCSITFSQHFDVVILSPLIRCIQTFNQCVVDYKNLYIWNEAREFMQDSCDFFIDESIKIETYERFSFRVDILIKRLKKLKDSNIKTVLIVSHCDLICELTGIALDNGAITKITY